MLRVRTGVSNARVRTVLRSRESAIASCGSAPRCYHGRDVHTKRRDVSLMEYCTRTRGVHTATVCLCATVLSKGNQPNQMRAHDIWIFDMQWIMWLRN